MYVVGHVREQPAQLDRGRQLAALLEGGTDRGDFSMSGHRMTRTCRRRAGI
jgi:hypothetical protein